MNKKQRKRRERERRKSQAGVGDEPQRPSGPEPAASPSLLRRFFGLVNKPARIVWAIVVAGSVLLSYSVLRPHVSLEPYIPLNPVDPYSTQFTVKNENSVFSVQDVECVCWPRRMDSGNGFSVLSFAPLQKVHRNIPLLEPGSSSTFDCPPVIGGIGSYSGEVSQAELEIDVSYRQSWWPAKKAERYAFRATRDVSKAVHWVHITPEEKSLYSRRCPLANLFLPNQDNQQSKFNNQRFLVCASVSPW